jgi:head-tail adaptor
MPIDFQVLRPTSQQRHRITLDGAARIPDGDGGYIEGWSPLTPPSAWASIQAATPRGLEKVTASVAVQAVATHLVLMDYHAQLTVTSRVTYHGRHFQIHVIENVDERNQQLVLVCSEIIGGSNDLGSVGTQRRATPTAE